MEKKDFVQKCGELLRIAKPHLVSCEFLLGKDIPENQPGHFHNNEEYVFIKCENGCGYVRPIHGNSLSAIAEEIFKSMVCK